MDRPSFKIKNLGEPLNESPLKLSTHYGDKISNYVDESERIILDTDLKDIQHYFDNNEIPPSLEKAGPRQRIYFNPPEVNAAIVTCGGLCPGLNTVIRSLVMELWHRYKARNIYGIRYGYAGFIPENGNEPLKLTHEFVKEIHFLGGTILGSSRGDQDKEKIVDFLQKNNISMLFGIGGDGTLKGLHQIWEVIEKRGLKISVVGIPKTIDNDISYIDKTFGFETAFSIATQAISSAHFEAASALNGIGLVKLMGRHSGYVAAKSSLALKEVNFVLVPELDFDLEGPNGFFECLKQRLQNRQHAVIIVAEGAGQNLIKRDKIEKDASGNIRLLDIGIFLKKRIKEYFKSQNFDITLKYIDPSYMIRSVAAIPTDNIFCGQLAADAVHAAMAGKTDMIVGLRKNSFVHIPIEAATAERKTIDLESRLWWDVLESTGQPMSMKNI